MGFVKTFDELVKIYRETIDFYDAEMLTVIWETKPEIVRRLLPPPLVDSPLGKREIDPSGSPVNGSEGSRPILFRHG